MAKDKGILVEKAESKFQPWLGRCAATGVFSNKCIDTKELRLSSRSTTIRSYGELHYGSAAISITYMADASPRANSPRSGAIIHPSGRYMPEEIVEPKEKTCDKSLFCNGLHLYFHSFPALSRKGNGA